MTSSPRASSRPGARRLAGDRSRARPRRRPGRRRPRAPPPAGVSVVVDYRELGGSTVTACAADGGGKSAAAIFASVGVRITYATRQPGFVCRVNGVPDERPVRQHLPRRRLLGAVVGRRHDRRRGPTPPRRGRPDRARRRARSAGPGSRTGRRAAACRPAVAPPVAPHADPDAAVADLVARRPRRPPRPRPSPSARRRGRSAGGGSAGVQPGVESGPGGGRRHGGSGGVRRRPSAGLRVAAVGVSPTALAERPRPSRPLALSLPETQDDASESGPARPARRTPATLGRGVSRRLRRQRRRRGRARPRL